MADYCALCFIGFGSKDRTRVSLHRALKRRGVEPSFAGEGPAVHEHCAVPDRADVQRLIQETTWQERVANSSATLHPEGGYLVNPPLHPSVQLN
jgi:hypothetical protein